MEENLSDDPVRARGAAAAGQKKRFAKNSNPNQNLYIALGTFGAIVAGVLGFMLLNPVLPPDMLQALNVDYMESQNALNLGFVQKSNEFFSGWTQADVISIISNGISQNARQLSPCESMMLEGELTPDAYDLRETWSSCVEPIYNQGNCTAAYAFSTASVLSERFCISSNGEQTVSLSAQDIISCDPKNNQCDGGDIDIVWNNIKEIGIVDNDCFPYSSEAHEVPDCDSKCENDKTYKVSHFCATTAAEGIKKEIYRNGPVVSAMIVYSDFLGYAGGIYKPHATATRFSGAQAVEIMGWGKDADTNEEFWIIKNSWGEDWGEEGYARIAQNLADLGLEDLVITGVPWLQEETQEKVQIVDTPAEDIQDESLDAKKGSE